MSGANIFTIYTSADGNNVTLSPRLGTGHEMPRFSNNAQVSLLEGSGVSNGVMTANVKCKRLNVSLRIAGADGGIGSNCNSWSGGTADFTSGSGNWIYAYQSSGGPKNTDDQSAMINYHSRGGVFSWNYANAKGGNSVNPLVIAAPSGTNNSDSDTANPDSGTTNPDSGFTPIDAGTASNRTKMLIAHGVLASLAFVILFPAGAIAMRLASIPGIVMIHAAFQVFAYLVYIAAFGLGVYIARGMNLVSLFDTLSRTVR